MSYFFKYLKENTAEHFENLRFDNTMLSIFHCATVRYKLNRKAEEDFGSPSVWVKAGIDPENWYICFHCISKEYKNRKHMARVARKWTLATFQTGVSVLSGKRYTSFTPWWANILSLSNHLERELHSRMTSKTVTGKGLVKGTARVVLLQLDRGPLKSECLAVTPSDWNILSFFLSL